MSFAFPASPVNSSPTADSMYFRIHVEPLTVPDLQKLQLTAFGYSHDFLRSQVVTGGDLTVTINGNSLSNNGWNHRQIAEGFTTGSTGFNTACPVGTGPLNVAALPRCNNVITVDHPQPVSGAQLRIWRVGRTTTAPINLFPFSVTWTTDVTAFYGGMIAPEFKGMDLKAVELTTDGSPHDEIGMKMNVDGVQLVAGGIPVIYVADYEDNTSKDVEPALRLFTGGSPARFKSSVVLTVMEFDSTNDFDVFSVAPRPRNVFGPTSAQIEDAGDWDIDGGFYTMPFLISHGTQRFP
jgi:hypothetical protein